jgi:predicted transcriptional regulator
MVKPRRKPGRPPLAPGGSTCINVRLANVTYDELYRLARVANSDVSVVIRRAIESGLVAERRTVTRDVS